MEKQCQANSLCSRRECIDVIDISCDASNKDLEPKVREMFNKVSCEILPRDTEASHVLTNSTDQTIIKSLQLKDCDAVMSVKKDLQKIKLEDFGQ